MLTRAGWVSAYKRCWICGDRPWTLDCHEISRGPARSAALREPAAWFATCRKCHMGPLDSMPVVRQLAYKKIHDPKHYDRVKVNRLRGRADNAITEDEVDQQVQEIGESDG